MDTIPIYSKLISESLLSLYPVFVKKISIPIDLQLWTRLITYVLISLFFINLSWISSNIFTLPAISLAIINIAHIYTSYEGFNNMDSGVAYSIFNIYPLLILLISGVSWKFEYFYAIGGLILFIYSSYLNKIKNNIANIVEINFVYGFGMMMIAALTEAFIYFIVRNLKTDNNWNQLFIAYFFGAILTSIWVVQKYLLEDKEDFTTDPINPINPTNPTDKLSFKNSGKLGLVGLAIIINGIIGSFGYWLRFYSLYRLDPATYSMLSFFGIIMAYFYGIVINGESIDIYKILGTVLIILSNILII
jgi:drug/metabolite transporter (DMT)-like permease